MYFQVSPVHKPKPTKKILPEPEETPVLSLAPFTAIPKICFDNVLINTHATKTLIIHNPTPNNIRLYITRAPPDERRFTLSWVECIVRSQEKVALELYWEATAEGGWKDTLTFEDGGRMKKDVSVIFKAIKLKKTKPKPKKVVKCVSTKVKSPKKWFSPKQKSPKPTTTRSALPDITNIPRISLESPRQNVTCNNENTYVKNKENLELSGVESLSFTGCNSEFIAKISTRNVFCDVVRNNSSKGSDENFDDSLEMQKEQCNTENKRTFVDHSPRTPLSIEDKLNAFMFTPTRTPFQPSFNTTGEKTQFLHKEEEAFNIDISSTATYDVFKRSPQLNLSNGTYVKSSDANLSTVSSGTYNIEERLSNISTGTFVKGNISSSTYTKDTITADLNFSDRTLSPIHFEGENGEICFDGSRPKKMLEQILEESTVSSDVSQLSRTDFRKRRSENCLNVTAPKRKSPNSREDEHSFRNGTVRRSFRTGKALNLKEFVMKTKHTCETLVTVEEVVVESSTTKVTKEFEHNISTFTTHNPFILTAINSIDPFMSGALYYDSKWVDEQENSFKKWLNALLTPPAELNSNTEAGQLDIVKLWQDCRKREVSKAPTKETVSSRYHTKTRLDSLRRNAGIFFRSQEISEILSKVCMMVENQRLIIRTDRDIHLDLGLQAEVLRLLLSYNPLWLRIGLETVYNTAISLHSNSDVVGLVLFLSEHFFKDQYLMRKFKSVHAKKYALEIKKLVLKRFLMLIFFLDKAKETKLIPHDPCLFCKNAPYKESRDIILKFSCELLSSIGDITRVLKHTNYILTHKQTYIHEFDYAVNNLGVDLRDGVRLTRVMEIILTVEGLTNKLRVPAISRLQKVHNMRIVFEALSKSGHTIMHEIEPKDIVDGHKEKTLSFLWQIIYKFQSPRITKAILTIQKFWRSLHVTIKRRILLKERLRRESAAIVIQQYYRRMKLGRKIIQIIPIVTEILHRRKLEKSATLIQSYFKTITQRKRYLTLRKSIIEIQRYSRRFLINRHIKTKISAIILIQTHLRMWIQRKRFLCLKASVRYVEETYTSKRLMQKRFEEYRKLKSTTLFIQAKFKAKLAMRKDLEAYIQLRSAAIFIQNKYRANKSMQKQRCDYLTLKTSTILLQQTIRANKEMKVQRRWYQQLRSSAISIQRYFRANIQRKIDQDNYRNLKRATLIIQTRLRATKLMLIERKSYKELRSSTILIQQIFRANRLMLKQRNHYQSLKMAATTIQQRFRAKKLMLRERARFETLKMATFAIQKRLRANLLMKQQRNEYLTLKNATKCIQSRYKAKLAMRDQKSRYIELKRATIMLQTRFRANKLMLIQKTHYQNLKKATISIQRLYRAKVSGRIVRKRYLELKSSVRLIEEHFLALKLMQRQRRTYMQMKHSVRIIEDRYKAKILAIKQKESFLELKRATVSIQRRFRAQKQMKIAEYRYKQLRSAAVTVQRRFRANRLCEQQKYEYQQVRRASLVVQNRFRANRLMKTHRERFVALKRAAIIIQERFRANRLCRDCRKEYLSLKMAVKCVESRFKAKKLAQKQFTEYTIMKQATIVIQRRYREYILTKKLRQEYLMLRRSVIIIQNKFRANKIAKIQQMQYRQLRDSTVTIQRRFRANKVGSAARRDFIEFRNRVISIQRRFRAISLGSKQRHDYLQLKHATNVIQQRFRAMQLSRKLYYEYQTLKRYTVMIQIKFRANRAMKIQRETYLRLKNATTSVQARFRANKMAMEQREDYLKLRNAAIVTQKRFRANILMLTQREGFLTLKKATVLLQRRFRLIRLAKAEEIKQMQLRKAVLTVESRFKAKLLGRKQLKVYKCLRESTILIQRKFRAHALVVAQRKRFLELRRAVVIVQRRFRANKLMRICRKEYLELRERTIMVQNRFRANILMKRDRESFRAIVKANLYLQRRFRATRLMKEYRNGYLRLRHVAIVVQKRYRALKSMKCDRARYLALKRAVLTIERRYLANKMMLKQRLEFLELKKSTVLIQKWFRNVLVSAAVRKEYLMLRKSVVTVQRRFRANRMGETQRKHYQILLKSVIFIQRLWRAKRVVRKTRANIIIVQAFVRGFLTRKIFAEQYLPVLMEKRERRAVERRAATKIQACWRGYKTRSVEKPELKNIRKKVKVANEKVVPQKTLAYKKEKALDIMVSEDSTLDQIISALQDLDYETRLFKQSCVDLSQCLPEELYRMITTSSRSVPEMQSCTFATNILINFCKYSTTIGNCWYPEYIDAVFTVMIHWCDKDYPLFAHLCTLIWHLAQDSRRKRFIIALPNLPHKLHKIKQLCERKYKMASKVQHKSATADMFGSYKNLPTPSIEPDWGLEYKERPRTFKNAVQAMHSLLNLFKSNC